MVGAVVHGHTEVDHRTTGQNPFVHGLDDPLLNCRDKVPGNGTPHDAVDELESLSSCQRRQFEPAITILAVSTGLLLILALRLRRASNGFLVRNLRRMDD